MLRVTQNLMLPTAITGSYPRPIWFTESLHGRSFKAAVGKERLSRGALEFSALWKVAQRLTDRPVKFGTICAPTLAGMLWNEHYRDEKALIDDLCDIFNAELRELAAAGCPLIQVEEPPHHGRTTRPDCSDADLAFFPDAFNRQLVGVYA